MFSHLKHDFPGHNGKCMKPAVSMNKQCMSFVYKIILAGAACHKIVVKKELVGNICPKVMLKIVIYIAPVFYLVQPQYKTLFQP